MVAHTERISLATREGVSPIDITRQVEATVARSGVGTGLACIFTPSSTSAILTNEFEPGLMEEDLPATLERLIPESLAYAHERRWADGNAHGHVRAMFFGPSLTIPVIDGAMALGTWQQIVFLELDNKPRQRTVLVQVVGEPPNL